MNSKLVIGMLVMGFAVCLCKPASALQAGNYYVADRGHCAVGYGNPSPDTLYGCVGANQYGGLYTLQDGEVCVGANYNSGYPGPVDRYWQIDIDVNRNDVGTSPGGWIQTYNYVQYSASASVTAQLIAYYPNGLVYATGNPCTVTNVGRGAQCNFGTVTIPTAGTLRGQVHLNATATSANQSAFACLTALAAG